MHDLRHACATSVLPKKANPGRSRRRLATIALDTHGQELPDMQDGLKAIEEAFA